MKFVRYQIKDQKSYGTLEGDLVQEISGSIYGAFKTTGKTFRLSEIRLLAPVEPTKILCVGLNDRGHIEELGKEIPQLPSHFIKPLTTLLGPEDPVIFPRVGKRVDYEGEVAVVIKNQIKDISEAEAMKHVLGFSCFNDVTERELARIEGQLTRSKGFDTFGPCGPCIATALDPLDINVRTYLNGKLMQEGNTKSFIFTIPYLISYLSQCMTLFPGDIISTGTPKGVSPMKPGDVVEVQVDGIGTLRNPIKNWK